MPLFYLLYIDQERYLHENRCPWDKVTTSIAAGKGQLECLKYAIENGCERDKKVCDMAARNGHLDCLKYPNLFKQVNKQKRKEKKKNPCF